MLGVCGGMQYESILPVCRAGWRLFLMSNSSRHHASIELEVKAERWRKPPTYLHKLSNNKLESKLYIVTKEFITLYMRKTDFVREKYSNSFIFQEKKPSDQVYHALENPRWQIKHSNSKLKSTESCWTQFC